MILEIKCHSHLTHGINARALSIRIYWVKIWNALRTFIQNSPTFRIFKKDVKLICWKLLVFLYKTLSLVTLLDYLNYHIYIYIYIYIYIFTVVFSASHLCTRTINYLNNKIKKETNKIIHIR